MKRYIGLLLVFPLSACSVGMAMSGKPSPNLGAVHQGISRGEVETQLGPAAQNTTNPDGTTTSTYHYEVGNDPSAGRAMGHAAMDVLTLGIWEVVGTPVEGSQGDKYRAFVTYSPDGTVTKVTTQPAGS